MSVEANGALLAAGLASLVLGCGPFDRSEGGAPADSSAALASALSIEASTPASSTQLSAYDRLRNEAFAQPSLGEVLRTLRPQMGDLVLRRHPVMAEKWGGSVLQDWMEERRVEWNLLADAESPDVGHVIDSIEDMRARPACLRGQGLFSRGQRAGQLVAPSGGKVYQHALALVGALPDTATFERIPNVHFCGFIVGRYLPEDTKGQESPGLSLVGMIEPKKK